MNVEHKDFIAIYKNVFNEKYCSHLITEFERLVSGGAGSDRQRSENANKHVKDDFQLGLNIKSHNTLNFEGQDTVDVFFNGLQECYQEYSGKYSVLRDVKINASTMKMQRTAPGGGYHIWHAEQTNGKNVERVLVYMLYLNTLTPEEAGETEFLYQQLRIKPEENTMVLWPAAYTHPHRGNTVFGENYKYIVTGWFYYE
jgi:hypothetical protein